jgi:hypothetical protein
MLDTVYLPSLFGRPGAEPTAGSIVRSVLRICVSREFAVLADRTSPVTSWLRALAARAHGECRGLGVGAIGMCLTGASRLRWPSNPTCVLGLRFSNDKGCPAERFQTLRSSLGDAFEAIEIDSSPGNPFAIPTRAHAVLTVDLVDEPGHPTRAALDRVIGFLDERLQVREADDA